MSNNLGAGKVTQVTHFKNGHLSRTRLHLAKPVEMQPLEDGTRTFFAQDYVTDTVVGLTEEGETLYHSAPHGHGYIEKFDYQPTKDRIVFKTGDEIRVLEAQSGAPVATIESEDDTDRVRALADGRVAFDNGSEVTLFDPKRPEEAVTLQLSFAPASLEVSPEGMLIAGSHGGGYDSIRGMSLVKGGEEILRTHRLCGEELLHDGHIWFCERKKDGSDLVSVNEKTGTIERLSLDFEAYEMYQNNQGQFLLDRKRDRRLVWVDPKSEQTMELELAGFRELHVGPKGESYLLTDRRGNVEIHRVTFGEKPEQVGVVGAAQFRDFALTDRGPMVFASDGITELDSGRQFESLQVLVESTGVPEILSEAQPLVRSENRTWSRFLARSPRSAESLTLYFIAARVRDR